MSAPDLLDKTYNVIIKRLLETGQAPHFTETAAELGIAVEEARKALHDLMAAGVPGLWLFPGNGLYQQFCPVQQPADAIPDHGGGRAEMVCPVRF